MSTARNSRVLEEDAIYHQLANRLQARDDESCLTILKNYIAQRTAPAWSVAVSLYAHTRYFRERFPRQWDEFRSSLESAEQLFSLLKPVFEKKDAQIKIIAAIDREWPTWNWRLCPGHHDWTPEYYTTAMLNSLRFLALREPDHEAVVNQLVEIGRRRVENRIGAFGQSRARLLAPGDLEQLMEEFRRREGEAQRAAAAAAAEAAQPQPLPPDEDDLERSIERGVERPPPLPESSSPLPTIGNNGESLSLSPPPPPPSHSPSAESTLIIPSGLFATRSARSSSRSLIPPGFFSSPIRRRPTRDSALAKVYRRMFEQLDRIEQRDCAAISRSARPQTDRQWARFMVLVDRHQQTVAQIQQHCNLIAANPKHWEV